MKSSAVCLRDRREEKSLKKNPSIHWHLTLIFFPFFLTLHWRGTSYARQSWGTCRSPSRSGTGRTLFSGPGGRCAGWGRDSATPVGCDPVRRHFLLRNCSVTEGTEGLRGRWGGTTGEVKLCEPVSVCLCDGNAWRDAEGKRCRSWHVVQNLRWTGTVTGAEPTGDL